MEVVAIVQARMRSTRFPGKVMREIVGKPVLWHVINRLKKAKFIDKIIVATTDSESDRAVIKLAEHLGIDSYAGSQDDVLDRYYQASKEYDAGIIVRVTADCPLIDPQIVDKVISHYLENKDKLDYVRSGLSFPDGVGDTEVFSFATLGKAWKEARLLSEREHVTPYIWKNPEIFRIATVENDEDLSDMRLVLDDENDFLVVAEIFSNLYKEGETFHLKDILNFLSRTPELLEFNKHIIRNEGYMKSLEEDRLVK
jgi:spore coat polysaccharide biosynthesis protein SpsF